MTATNKNNIRHLIKINKSTFKINKNSHKEKNGAATCLIEESNTYLSLSVKDKL